MKKRKILALLCVASLSAGLLAGCGSDKKEESSTTESKENTDNEEASEDQEEVSGFTDGNNGANVEEPEETTDETSEEDTASDAGEDSTEDTASDTGKTSGVLLDTSEQLTGIDPSCGNRGEGLRYHQGGAGCRYCTHQCYQLCKTGTGAFL